MDYFDSVDIKEFLTRGELGNLKRSPRKYLHILEVLKKSYSIGYITPYTSDVKKTLREFLGFKKPIQHFYKIVEFNGELYPSIHGVIKLENLMSRTVLKDIREGKLFSLIRAKTPADAVKEAKKITDRIGSFDYEPSVKNEWVAVKTSEMSLPCILRNSGYTPLALYQYKNTVKMICGICKEIQPRKIDKVYAEYKKKANEKYNVDFIYPETKKFKNKDMYLPKDSFLTRDAEFFEFLYSENPKKCVVEMLQVLRTLQLNGMLYCLNGLHMSDFLHEYLGIPKRTIHNHIYRVPREKDLRRILIEKCSKTCKYKYEIF